MKVVLTVFAPILVALAIRLALFILGIAIGLLNLFLSGDFGGRTAEGIGTFETFNFEESWGYWVLVVIGSFLAEIAIWSDN